MNKKREVEISRMLSHALRHQPELYGIQLNLQGWADIEMILDKMMIDQNELEFVVNNKSKRRFSISDDKKSIRANQGHSINIQMDLIPNIPPTILYHGTSMRTKRSILNDGISRMKRNHVHLSSDVATAIEVGRRHGKPIVFKILAKMMYEDKFEFFISDNRAWLTKNVPPKYLEFMD